MLVLLIWGLSALPAAAGASPTQAESAALYTAGLAWLVPIGLGLLACGTVPAGRVAPVIRTGWLALVISAVTYWLCGFAFQFGGIGFVAGHPDLAGLAREWVWSPLRAAWGGEWGMLGLEGFLLRPPAATPAAFSLFLAQLPWLTTAVALPLWSLQGRARPAALPAAGLLAALLYVLIGNWTWGGGWLANLGLNLEMGHGLVDLTGAGAIHLAGAAMALAGMLAFGIRPAARSTVQQLSLPTVEVGAQTAVAADGETYVTMPPLHLPLLGTLGAWLALIGTMAWIVDAPSWTVHPPGGAWAEMGIKLVLAAAGGAAVSLAFCWLTTGEGNALMVARGALGAAVAAGAGLPFVPFGAALAIGAIAGLLVPLVQYLIDHVLRLDDPTSVVATHGVPALWGLLAVGLAADGLAGQGWNRVAGSGVIGWLGAVEGAPWFSQFRAQLAGAAVIVIAAFMLSWLLFAAIQGLTRAWQGEYTIRLPAGRRPPRRRFSWHLPRFHLVKAAPEPPAPSPAASAPDPDREDSA